MTEGPQERAEAVIEEGEPCLLNGARPDVSGGYARVDRTAHCAGPMPRCTPCAKCSTRSAPIHSGYRGSQGLSGHDEGHSRASTSRLQPREARVLPLNIIIVTTTEALVRGLCPVHRAPSLATEPRSASLSESCLHAARGRIHEHPRSCVKQSTCLVLLLAGVLDGASIRGKDNILERRTTPGTNCQACHGCLTVSPA
jgi:hypothetical protein